LSARARETRKPQAAPARLVLRYQGRGGLRIRAERRALPPHRRGLREHAPQPPQRRALSPKDEKQRCRWVPLDDPDYIRYHDREWGRPIHDDRLLFEMLILEGAQAGLSWSTILHKRAGYQRAFANFDPKKVARFDAARKTALMQDPGIVRNRLKIESTVSNARAFLEVQREFGSFDQYLWSFVDGRPLVNGPTARTGVPARTELS